MSETAASVVLSILRKSIGLHLVSGCPSGIHRGSLVCSSTMRLLFSQACAIVCAGIRAVFAHPLGLSEGLFGLSSFFGSKPQGVAPTSRGFRYLGFLALRSFIVHLTSMLLPPCALTWKKEI